MKHVRTLGAVVVGLITAAVLTVPMATASVQQKPKRKVTICHVTGSAKNPYVLIRVSRNALPAHRRHGDFRPSFDRKHRKCVPPSTKSDPKRDGPKKPRSGKRKKITVCHVTGSAANPYVLIRVSRNALPAHRRHGDFRPSFDRKHRKCVPPSPKTNPKGDKPTDPKSDAPTDPKGDEPTDPKGDAPTDPKQDPPADPKHDHPTDPDNDKPTNPKPDVPRTITICHATGSATNPYVLIRVSRNALPAHRRHGDFRPTYEGKQLTCVAPTPKPGAGKVAVPEGKRA